LTVNLNLNGKILELTIFDNGKVNKSQIKNSGLGLMNLSERADRVDGDLKIDYGDGFKIEFVVDLK
jgi:Signal transduction histidine kinase